MASTAASNGEMRSVTANASTHLLSWNPTKWAWPNLEEAIAEVRENGRHDTEWTCGNTRNLPIGSRFYLIRLGDDPKGLAGSGVTLSSPREGQHWDADKQASGGKAMRVRVRFDRLARTPFVRRNELNSEPFNHVHWDIQASGARINEAVVPQLAALWSQRHNVPTAADVARSAPVTRRWRARWEAAQAGYRLGGTKPSARRQATRGGTGGSRAAPWISRR